MPLAAENGGWDANCRLTVQSQPKPSGTANADDGRRADGDERIAADHLPGRHRAPTEPVHGEDGGQHDESLTGHRSGQAAEDDREHPAALARGPQRGEHQRDHHAVEMAGRHDVEQHERVQHREGQRPRAPVPARSAARTPMATAASDPDDAQHDHRAQRAAARRRTPRGARSSVPSGPTPLGHSARARVDRRHDRAAAAQSAGAEVVRARGRGAAAGRTRCSCRPWCPSAAGPRANGAAHAAATHHTRLSG